MSWGWGGKALVISRCTLRRQDVSKGEGGGLPWHPLPPGQVGWAHLLSIQLSLGLHFSEFPSMIPDYCSFQETLHRFGRWNQSSSIFFFFSRRLGLGSRSCHSCPCWSCSEGSFAGRQLGHGSSGSWGPSLPTSPAPGGVHA